MSDRKYDKHPSWAMIEFSRMSGFTRLFGSHGEHGSFIEMRVKPCERYHEYGHDHYFSPNKPYCTVRMTFAQFAEAITNLNNGLGIPCTLSYLEGMGRIEEPPKDRSEGDRAEDYVAAKGAKAKEEADESVNRIKAIFDKPSVGKKDREEILKLVASIAERFKRDVPFYVDQYIEATEKIKTKAMIEFEAMVNMRLQSLGLTAAQVGLALPEKDGG